MVQRPDRGSSDSKATPGRSGGGRRRTAAPVKKPFPWGTVAISAVVGLALIGILGYAVTNQGSGFVDPLKAADKSVEGVAVADKEESRHTEAPVKYDKEPPTGGNHNPTPQSCLVYPQPIANENAVHSLEHGAVWVTYRPDLAPGDIKKLAEEVQGDPYRLMSPYPGLKSPISLQAWGRQLFVDKVSDGRIEKFLDAYTNGPQAPERGAACQGTSSTGPLSPPPPAPPSPPASAAASPTSS